MSSVHSNGGNRPFRRPAYAISPLVVLLAAAMLGFVAWKTFIQFDHVPPTYPGASEIKSKYVTTNTTTATVLLSIAGGIGAGCYFAFGKSQRAAHAGMSVILAIGAGLFGVQLFRYYAYGAATVTAPSAASAGAAPSTSDSLKRLADAMQESAERSRAAQEKMRSEMNEAMERTRAAAEAARNPRPFTPPAPAPSNFQPSTVPPPAPGSSAPAQTPRPAPQRSSTPDPAVTAALDDLKAEVDKQVGDFVTQAKAFMDSVDKPPPRSMPVMDKRAADAKQLKTDAAALTKRLRGFDDEVEKRLADVGIDKMASMHERMRFTMEYKAAWRASACDDYGRLCDEVVSESELLKRGFNNWKYDASGKISSKDKQLEFEAHSLRNRIEMALRRADELAARVRGE